MHCTRGDWLVKAILMLRIDQRNFLLVPQTLLKHWTASKHAPLQQQNLWDGFDDATERGWFWHIAVSNFRLRQLEEISLYLQTRREIRLASLQVQTSLLSREHLQPRAVTDTERRLEVSCVGFSPLCLGLLSGEYTRDRSPTKPRELLCSVWDLGPFLNVKNELPFFEYVRSLEWYSFRDDIHCVLQNFPLTIDSYSSKF